MHGKVTAGQHVKMFTCYSTQILVFICHYYKYEPTWVAKHQSLSWRWSHIQPSLILFQEPCPRKLFYAACFSHIRNQRASDKRRAVPRSYIQVLFWTKLSTVWGFEDCEILRVGSHSGHTLYTVDHHTDVVFLQKSVKFLTNIIPLEVDVFVTYWYHTYRLKAHKINRK